MTGQIKQRIVGIIVLIFLALILLPWLIESKHPPVRQTSKPHTPIVLHSIKENKITPTPVVTPKATVPIPQKDTVEQLIQPSHKAINTSNSTPIAERLKNIHPEATEAKQLNATKIVNIENKIVHTAPHVKHITHSKPTKKEKTLVTLQKPKLTNIKIIKKTTTQEKKKPMTQGWAVQLGSFTSKSNVDNLIKQLKSKHFLVFTQKGKNAQGIEATRVFVGPESLRESADMTAKKIEQMVHVHGVVVKSTL